MPDQGLDPHGTWSARIRELAARHGADARRLIGEHYMRAVSRWYLGDDPETACLRAFQHVAGNFASTTAEAA